MPFRRRRVSGSRPTTPRLCELTLRILNVGGRPCCRARISEACSAAPWATASSAATESSGSMPDSRRSISRTIGMRVDPPTSRTRSRSLHCESRRPQRLHRGEAGAVQQVLRGLLELLRGRFRSAPSRPDAGRRRWPSAGRKGSAWRLRTRARACPPMPGSSRGSTWCSADEALGHEIDQPLVPVVAAQADVAVGGQGDELGAADLHHGHVERAAAEVVDQDRSRGRGAALVGRGSPAGSRRPRRRPSAR